MQIGNADTDFHRITRCTDGEAEMATDRAQDLIQDAKSAAVAYVGRTCKPLPPPTSPYYLRDEQDQAQIRLNYEIGALHAHIRTLCVELEIAAERSYSLRARLDKAYEDLADAGLMETDADDTARDARVFVVNTGAAEELRRAA
jgi:hypothetical protein